MTRRTSRKRTSLRRNSYKSVPAGRKVVLAFLDKHPASSSKLSTDGRRLDGMWMGGRGIAEWSGGKIVFNDLGSRSAQTVQRQIRRLAPASWLRPNSRRRTSLRRNSSYSTTYRSPEDKARLAVEALRDRDITDPARQQAELNLAGMYRTKSPRTAASVRRKIAAAEAERERALEALEKATFAGASTAEQRFLKYAFERADAHRFQARMQLAEMGLRRNSSAIRPVTKWDEIQKIVLSELRANQWEWTAQLDDNQLVELSKMTTNALVKSWENEKRSRKRYKLGKPSGATMTEERIRGYVPANSRNYAALVVPFDFEGSRIIRNPRRTSLRRNSADWSTRTAVAAKARAAFARGDSRSANRYLSELSAIDLAMMPRALRRNGDPYSTTFHKDGTITFWSVYDQSWVRHARDLDDADWSSMSPKERARVEKHFAPRRASLHRNRTRRTSRRRTSRR